MTQLTVKQLMEQQWNEGEIKYPNNLTRWQAGHGALFGSRGRPSLNCKSRVGNNFSTAKKARFKGSTELVKTRGLASRAENQTRQETS